MRLSLITRLSILYAKLPVIYPFCGSAITHLDSIRNFFFETRVMNRVGRRLIG